MVEKRVKELADGFALFFNGLFSSSPNLQLDGCWPSIGTVDKCLFSLRGKSEFSEADNLMIIGASAYIGIIAHDCWKNFPGLSLELETSGTGTDGIPEEIVLRATGGNHLANDQRVVVQLKRSIERILKQPENPFPAFADEKRMLAGDNNLLSLFAAGLACGLTPYGSGGWKGKRIEKMQDYLDFTALELASSCANYFRRCYPIENITAAPELYLPHLTLPPAGYSEPHLAVRAVARFIEHCRTQNFSSEQISRVAANFASCPDELLSLVGFAVGTALAEDEAGEIIRAIGTQLGPGAALLRPAVMLARTMSGREEDIFDHLLKGELEAAKTMFKLEYQSGLVPLCYMPGEQWLEDPMLQPLAHFLSWSQLDEAWQVIEELEFHEITSPELYLQQSFLELNRHNLSAARETLTKIPEQLISEKKELSFRAHDLLGRICLAQKQPQSACEHLEQAMIVGTTDRKRFAECGVNLAGIYFSENKLDQGLMICEQVVARDPVHPQAHFQLMIALLTQNRVADLALQIDTCAKLLSVSPRLFTLVKDYLISTKHAADSNR